MPNIVEIIVSTVDKSKGGIESAEGGFSSLNKVAVASLAGIGLAAAALGDQLFKAMDIEAANDKLAAQLGLGAEASAYYGQLAGDLYSQNYGESLDQVNESLRYVNQNIGDLVGESEGAFENASKSALDFASVFDVELSESTRAAGALIKNGLAKDAQEAFDIMTVGFQNGANAGDDLTDTITEYSPLFSKLGLSGQQALGMISQSMKAGARDSDFAADAIKEFSIRAIDGSDLTAQSFQALGLNADKMRATFAKGGPESAAAMDLVFDKLRGMKDPAKQAEVAIGLFGTKAEDLGATLMAMDPSGAVASLGQVEGAAKKMGDTLADNAKSKLEGFKRTIETNVSDFIGNVVLPKVVELAEKAGPAFQTFQDVAGKAFEWVSGKPEALAAIATVVGVALVAAFVSLGIAAWGAAAGVIAATWPIIAIAAAIALLAAGIMYAWNNWDTFRNVIMTVVGAIQANAMPVFEMIKQAVITFYETALAPLIGYVMANGEAFANIGKILLVIVGIIVGVVIVAILMMVAQWLIMVAVAAVVIAAIVAIIAVIYNIIQVLWEWIGTIRDVAGGVLDNIENVIQIFWDLANNVGTAIANVVRAVWMVIQVGWDLAQNIGSAIADAVRFVWSLAMKANDMANEMGAAVGRAVGWFFGLPGRILGAVGDLGGVLLGAGRSIIDGLVRGIENGIQKVKDILGRVTGLIPDWKGPAQKDAELLEPSGGLIMGGLMRGIGKQVPNLRRQLGSVTDMIPSAIEARARLTTVAQVAAASAGTGGAGTVHNWYVQGSIRSDRDLVRLMRDSQNDLGLAPGQGG